jgi:hypothetical protein
MPSRMGSVMTRSIGYFPVNIPVSTPITSTSERPLCGRRGYVIQGAIFGGARLIGTLTIGCTRTSLKVLQASLQLLTYETLRQ